MRVVVLLGLLILAVLGLVLLRARRAAARRAVRTVPALRGEKPQVPSAATVRSALPLSAPPPRAPAAGQHLEPQLTPPRAAPSSSQAPSPQAVSAPVAEASAERLRAGSAAIQEVAQEVGADFFDEIAKLLQAELEKSPARRDLRYKLMEVYASAERRDLFVEQTRLYINGLGGRADTYWPRIVAMGRELAPETGLYTDHPPLNLTPPAAPVRPMPVQRARRFYDGVNQMQLSAMQLELQDAYKAERQDLGFWKDMQALCEPHIATPSPLAAAPQLSAYLGGARLYFKNERQRPLADAAKMSAAGQLVLAKRMGKQRVVAGGLEDGHAFVVAAAARQLGLACTIHVHEQERQRYAGEIAEIETLGATLTDVRDSILGAGGTTQAQALADSLGDRAGSFYVSPLAAGPQPYPMIVRDLQGLSGRNLRAQIVKLTGRMPDALIVSTADGMHAVGMLQPFLKSAVRLHCVEAAQDLTRSSRERFTREHSWLRATERVHYATVPPDVAHFAAGQCLPDGWHELHAAGGEVLAESFGVARALMPEQIVVVVIPADSAAKMQTEMQVNAA